ncbi:MEDS domain-containing protein [Noviherbaspirillum sp. ST 5-3]|uniref:MEDS domain-containing protein n=1 Tax=Noviherbaspirillum sp. ST 5-3 TaxID=3349878 RepID=UPI003916FFF3
MSNATPWQTMLSRPVAGDHIVQFYRRDDQLTETVSYFIAEGLRMGEAVVVVASSAHWAFLVGRLVTHKGFDLVDVVLRGQLRIVDADVSLMAVMANGMPQWFRFRDHGVNVIQRARKHFKAVRIYGEMSDTLWQKGNGEAANRIAEYWNELAEHCKFSLLRAYKVDDFDTDRYHLALDAARRTCTQLLPRLDGRPHPEITRGASQKAAAA